MTPSLRSVLAIGVRGLPGWSPAEAQKLISAEKEKATKAGFELDVLAILPSQPEKQIIEEVEKALSKRNFAGVALGFGIRGDRELTPLFEKITNLVMERVEPMPKLAFPLLPDEVVKSFERVLPSSQSQEEDE